MTVKDVVPESTLESALIPLASLSARGRSALQAQLDALTSPAIVIDADYGIVASNSAYAVHYGQRVRPGDHCFQVSHGYSSPCDDNGEDCPLAQARRSGRAERVCHVHHHTSGPEHVDVELRPIHGDVGEQEGSIVAFLEIITPIPEARASVSGKAALVGRSRAFSHLLSMIRRVAPTEAPVLLLGESGTGKELCARAVHDASARASGPYVPVECAGLSESLFESELFGHARGAFTGATTMKRGLVEAAEGGTLFLDELGDVPPALQVKLLRLLETGTFRRVGETELRRADFRLVSATHRDLPALVESGAFRADLFYRLNLFPVLVPPLRERLDDVPLLAEAILAGSGKSLSSSSAAALQQQPFPGNIRELKNILLRAVILSDGRTIHPEALQSALPAARMGASASSSPSSSPSSSSSSSSSSEPGSGGGRGAAMGFDALRPLDDLVDDYLLWAAEQHLEREDLAAALGLSPRTLYRRLAEARRRRPGGSA